MKEVDIEYFLNMSWHNDFLTTINSYSLNELMEIIDYAKNTKIPRYKLIRLKQRIQELNKQKINELID